MPSKADRDWPVNDADIQAVKDEARAWDAYKSILQGAVMGNRIDYASPEPDIARCVKLAKMASEAWEAQS